jgi:diadenosine tetraphosphate (Ap4A) HIT family hydrolase
MLCSQGQDIGALVHYRDADSIVFDDKYPVSANHLDVIPTLVYQDITVLTREHIPVLERLHALALEEFKRRNIAWLPAHDEVDPSKPFDLASLLTAGYNFPVSVKHLHLHAVLPPFKHEKVFQYPRWHAHNKVMADLREHGVVKLYEQGRAEDDAEGAREYERAMANSARAKQLQDDYNAKQAQAQ